MSSVQLFTYVYLIILFVVSLKSYRLCINLIWCSLLLIPSIMLERYIRYVVLISLFSCFCDSKHWEIFSKFLLMHKTALLFFIMMGLTIITFSDVVPVKNQLGWLTTNISWILLVVETFLLCRSEQLYARQLLMILCCCIIVNTIYSIYFEIYLRVNPAGLPLYILMGLGDNQYLADMVNRERGVFAFRLQSIFGHPISLGQYFCVITPVLFYIRKKVIRIMLISIVCVIVFLTGSRGAFIPLFCFIILYVIETSLKKKQVVSLIVPLFMLFLIVTVLTNTVDWFNWDMFAFWDDKKQMQNNFIGSDMALRISQLESAVKEIEGNYLFGKGFGYRGFFQDKFGGLHPKLLGYESVLILHLVERGWLGLIFFFITIVYIYIIFKNNTSTPFTISLVFFAYIISITMTGVRPYTFALVGLTCSIICGISNNNIKLK